CGTDHSRMVGRVVVMQDVEYQDWLSGYTQKTPVEEGAELFTQFDCSSCHNTGQRQRCPTLGGLYGVQGPIEGGTALFDGAYIRESVYDPTAKIARGFEPLMPSFRGQISEEQMLA